MVDQFLQMSQMLDFHYRVLLKSFSNPLNHRQIGNGWATWSHGYTGDVYYEQSNTVTITLPAGTRAFYLYIEGNNFGTANITATANDGTTSGPIPVVGASGARYYGFIPQLLLVC